MHLAQTLIKGTDWEGVLFPQDESLQDLRMLQAHWKDAEAFYSAERERSEQEIEARKERSIVYLEQRRLEKAKGTCAT